MNLKTICEDTSHKTEEEVCASCYWKWAKDKRGSVNDNGITRNRSCALRKRYVNTAHTLFWMCRVEGFVLQYHGNQRFWGSSFKQPKQMEWRSLHLHWRTSTNHKRVGDAEMLKEKWVSVIRRVTGRHDRHREQALSPMCSWAPWYDESWRWALVKARIWSPRRTRVHCERQEAFERPGSSDEVHPRSITRGMFTYRNIMWLTYFIFFFSFQIQVVLRVSQIPSKENTFWIWCDDPRLMLAAQDHNSNVNREQVGERSLLLSFVSTVCHLILYIKMF